MQLGCIVAYYHCKATNKKLDMKTISKHYQRAENVALIQLESVEGEGFEDKADHMAGFAVAEE